MVSINRVSRQHYWTNHFWFNNWVPFNNFYNPFLYNPYQYNHPRTYGAWPYGYSFPNQYGYGFPNSYGYMQNFYNPWLNPFNRFNNFARFNYPFYSNFYPRNLFGFNYGYSPLDQLSNMMDGGISGYTQFNTGPNQIDFLSSIMGGINMGVPLSTGYSPLDFLRSIMNAPASAAWQILGTTIMPQVNNGPFNYLGSG